MKEILALLLVFTMLFSFAACKKDDNDDTVTDQPPEETVDPSEIIDIYIIAGQSNAVGHTRFLGTGYESYVRNSAPEIGNGGFTHVHYAGNSRTDTNNHTVLVNNDKPWQKTTLGFGSNENNIGPELGMAKALSAYYNETSGRNAGIIKFAHGGTSIRNITSGQNAFGNWVSPSYAQSLGLSYNDGDITGALYRGLLEQVKRNISELEAYGGFTQINIRGLYWMQGESDRSQPAEYKKAFTFFVEDLRKDLSDIMLEFTGGESDLGASEMGIFVGAISRGYNISDSTTENNVNVPFINIQKQLAVDIENCYFVDNTEYAITKWDNASGVITLGSDMHHWNAKDMFDIGKNVGEMMFDKCVRASSVK